VVAADKKAKKGLNSSSTMVGQRTKKPRVVTHTFAGSKDAELLGAGVEQRLATSTIQIDTAHDQDAQAIFERQMAITKDLKDTGTVIGEENVYRGLNGYALMNERKETQGGNAYSGVTMKGPARGTQSIRENVRWDYAPDICKDYKETGFCGYGDSCKFLHDRGDYKHGWQIDGELDGGIQGKYAGNDFRDKEGAKDIRSYEIDSDEEEALPFACFICKDPFVKPVVTKCKHYFCEKCALTRYKTKSTKCGACGAQTNGIFKPAKAVLEKLAVLQKKKEAEKSGSGTNLVLGDEDEDEEEDEGGVLDEEERGEEEAEEVDRGRPRDDDEDEDEDEDEGGEDADLNRTP
jgi:RING finger protein 113A